MRYGSLTYNACSCISHWLVQRLNIKSATLLDTGANEAVEYAWDANSNMTSDELLQISRYRKQKS